MHTLLNFKFNNKAGLPSITPSLVFSRKVNNLPSSPKSPRITNTQIPELASNSTVPSNSTVAQIGPQTSEVPSNSTIAEILPQIPELASNYTGAVIAPQTSEVPSNYTIVQNVPQIDDTHSLQNMYRELYRPIQQNTYRAVDDTYLSLRKLHPYIDSIEMRVEEVQQSIYAIANNIANANIPQILSDLPGLMSDSDFEEDDEDEDMDYLDDDGYFEDDDNSDNGSLDNGDNAIPDNSIVQQGNEPNQLVGMEPLNYGIPINEVTYSDLMRIDSIAYSNYSIDMQGLDDMAYRSAYIDIIDCINNLDILIALQQRMVQLEQFLAPLSNQLDLDSGSIGQEISCILNILSHLQ